MKIYLKIPCLVFAKPYRQNAPAKALNKKSFKRLNSANWRKLFVLKNVLIWNITKRPKWLHIVNFSCHFYNPSSHDYIYLFAFTWMHSAAITWLKKTNSDESLFGDVQTDGHEWACRSFYEFRSRRWGSSLLGLRTRDPPLSPPSTWAEIFCRTCLQSNL
jgi:hypothetical protein